MTTFQSNNAYFGTEAKVGASGTTGNTKLSATSLVVTGVSTLLSTTYSGTGISSNASTGNSFDITTNGFTFNSLAGAVGNLLISAGASDVPTWLAGSTGGYYLASGGVSSAPVWTIFPTIPTAYVIQKGSIVFPAGVTGTQALSGFSSAPYITLTVDGLSGSTTIIPVGLAGVTSSAFNWVLGTALTAGQSINWIAIQ
jgi:hypothetical protein